MSAYANYSSNTSAESYASGRNTVGLETIIGAIATSLKNTKSLHECRVLDAGCGPGNYCCKIAPLVGKIDCVDNSEAMLSVASKCAEEKHIGEKCRFIQVDMNSRFEIGLDSQFYENYDAIYCCQVLQHLQIDTTKEKEAKFVGAQNALFQFYHMLRVGGALIITLCTRQQRENGFWWKDLVPNATERFIQRVPQPEDLRAMLLNAGFSVLSVANMQIHQEKTETLQRSSEYSNIYGPLEHAWRVADSTWSLVTSQELEQVTETIKNDKDWPHKAKEMIEKAKNYGQNTTYVVYK